MQIVKVEPLAKINAIFPKCAGTGEYNIDGFDTREKEGTERRKGRSIEHRGGARNPHYLLNHRRGISYKQVSYARKARRKRLEASLRICFHTPNALCKR